MKSIIMGQNNNKNNRWNKWSVIYNITKGLPAEFKSIFLLFLTFLIFGIGSNIYGIILNETVALYLTFFSYLCAMVALVIVINKKLTIDSDKVTELEIDAKVKSDIINELRDDFDETFKFMAEFVRGVKIEDPKWIDNEHHIKNYSKEVNIYGKDYDCTRRIQGTVVCGVTDGIKFKIAGGSSRDYNTMECWHTDNSSKDKKQRRPLFLYETDGSKVLKAEYPIPKSCGEPIDITVYNKWPDAMRIAADGFLFYDTLQFKKGLEKYIISVKFDREPIHLKLYCANVEDSTVNIDPKQPSKVSSSNSHLFRWEKEFRNAENLNYFFILYFKFRSQ